MISAGPRHMLFSVRIMVSFLYLHVKGHLLTLYLSNSALSALERADLTLHCLPRKVGVYDLRALPGASPLHMC